MRDVIVVNAASLVPVHDRGGPRRGEGQGQLEIIRDGAVVIKEGSVAAVGETSSLLAEYGTDDAIVIDASGKTVIPGLVEAHSHPLFAGERHHEYARRLAGATLAEIAAEGGGIWSSVLASRQASDEELLATATAAYARIVSSGATTIEVKSGYGLTLDEELRHLELLRRSRGATAADLVVTLLAAHVVPRDGGDADAYTDLIVDQILPDVVGRGLAEFHDVTCEAGLFTPEQALRLLSASREHDIPAKVHADAWASSRGWEVATGGGAISADHLTYTPDEEIRAVGATDTVAVLLPAAELEYMTERRANARLFIENGVAVAVATDFCSSIHATSTLTTLAMAAPWFRMTPNEVLVAGTLNAAYAVGRGGDRGSLDVGKRGDLVVLDCPHPDEIPLAFGAPIVDVVVAGGALVERSAGSRA